MLEDRLGWHPKDCPLIHCGQEIRAESGNYASHLCCNCTTQSRLPNVTHTPICWASCPWNLVSSFFSFFFLLWHYLKLLHLIQTCCKNGTAWGQQHHYAAKYTSSCYVFLIKKKIWTPQYIKHYSSFAHAVMVNMMDYDIIVH